MSRNDTERTPDKDLQSRTDATDGADAADGVDRDSGRVKFATSLPLEEAISYFEAIVAGMKKGAIHLRQGDRDLRLEPPAHLALEVKATRKRDKEKISFELAWDASAAAELKISAE